MSKCYSDGMTCGKCGESLRGGDRTLKWEDGDNPYEYIYCPHYGCKNIVEDDD